MGKGPIRRSQLISPFGVGALTVTKEGTSVITCGLDHWYKSEDVDKQSFVNAEEYCFKEWRLQRILNVDHFRLPPDFRLDNGGTSSKLNRFLTVPFHRFPTWHFCPRCHTLSELPLSYRTSARCKSEKCQKQKYQRKLVQVSFIAICEAGHVQDFPWRKWLKHKKPDCPGTNLRLESSGGTSLAAQKVICDDCEGSRSLLGATDESGLQSVGATCDGNRPWLGNQAQQKCVKDLRGSLRNAANVYYPLIESAIFLPIVGEEENNENNLKDILSAPRFSAFLGLISGGAITVTHLRGINPELLATFSDEQILSCIKVILTPEEAKEHKASRAEEQAIFRAEEFEVLRKDCDGELNVTHILPTEYGPGIHKYFSSIGLADKIRETRVHRGFSRISYASPDLISRDELFWKNPPSSFHTWLPGYIVHGEGIFFQFNENSIREWLGNQPNLNNRTSPLKKRYEKLIEERGYDKVPLGPRYLLVHTFSHLLMNQLVFDCGYSTASLRERLYVSDDESDPMAAVLIYTASGDSEGTLGGLVRMGKPGNLEHVIAQALSRAEWCSADPVCSEGARLGQGPDSCNLAACHSCALVPETACEQFNRFLDRSALIGDEDGVRGYFHSI